MNIENPTQLLDYLNGRGVIPEEVQITPLHGGVSNRTVKIDFNGSSWVMKQALKKLRVKGDWFSPPERIFHEAEAIRWMNQQVDGNCPEFIFEDSVEYIIAMEAIRHPFKNLKDILLRDTPDPKLCLSVGELMGQIHAKGQIKPSIPTRLHDPQFFHSLRVQPYYLETSGKLKQTFQFYQQLISESKDDPFTLTHGDFSPKNLLVKKQQLVLLDYEVAHFGDGTFDLGFFMTHLLAKSIYRPAFRKLLLLSAKEFFNAYRIKNNIDHIREQRAVKHTIGCLLARVCGLSPLEYLKPGQQQLQKRVALQLIEDTPSSIGSLISKFNSLVDA